MAKIPLGLYLIPSNQIIDAFLICLQTMLQQWIGHPRLKPETLYSEHADTHALTTIYSRYIIALPI